MTSGARSRQRARKGVRNRSRHSRRKVHKAQWFSVTALAVLGVVMVAHPDATSRSNVAARFGRSVDAVGPRGVVPTQVPTPTATFTTPLRPVPSSTRQPKASKPNVTRSTGRLCLPLDTGGEVSCRVENRVVLNAKRWMYAVPAYQGKVGLYRSYLVNHEVGHALGHGHSTCAKADTPAPVMLQQTKGLGGCLPNAWPTIKAT